MKEGRKIVSGRKGRQMKKIMNLALIIVLIISLSACSSNKSNEPTNGNGNTNNENQVTEPVDKAEDESYVPDKAVPKDLPVYPNASLIGEWDYPAPNFGENSWQWDYKSNGSGNEIVEFFRKEFENLGLEVDEDFTGAGGEEFYVNTVGQVVGVYFLGEDGLPEDVSGDTPGRHYGIVVDLDKWHGVDPEDRPQEVYVPKKEFVKSVPIYPGAVIVDDTATTLNNMENCWMWTFKSDASANEIVDFYERELEKLGYEVEYASAFQDSISLHITDYYITVQDSFDLWGLSDLPDEVDPDTPGRAFDITVNLDKIK